MQKFTVRFLLKIKGERKLVKKLYRGSKALSIKEAMEKLKKDMEGKDYEILKATYELRIIDDFLRDFEVRDEIEKEEMGE